jgi:outer membrane receptor protein involved in Fe transport
MATVTSLLSAPAFAQQGTQATAATQVQEIVITALKRDTNIQRTPMSINAVTGADLANSGVQDISNLTQSVPSLTFVDGGPSNTRVVIRGIQSAGEPTVGIYYDETPVSGAVGATNDSGGTTPLVKLFDVERVEVLQGPQGTLYGSGSMGGTVRVIFNKPVFKLEGAVEADGQTVDHGATGDDVQAMVNVPLLADKLAVRAVGFVEDQGGYVDNTYLHEKDVNDFHATGGRFLVRYEPSDKLTIDGSVLYQNSEGQNPTWTREAGDYISIAQTQAPFRDTLSIYNLTARWDLGHVVATAVVSDTERRFSEATGDASYFIDQFLNNPAICSAIVRGPCSPGAQAAVNAFVSHYTPSALYGAETVSTPTAELRLSSNDKGFLDWTVGVFYSDRTTHDNNSEYGANPATGALLKQDVLYTRLINDELKQVAGFVDVSAHLTDKLTFSTGARYFDYTRDVGGSTPLGLILIGANAAPFQKVNSSQDGVVGKFNLSYQFDRNLLFYTEASQGFRPGGVNQVVGLPTALTPYQSDSLWDYEVGAKTSWLDRRLVFDADGYLIDWNNMQVAGRTPNGAFSFIANAGAAQVKGFEVNLSAIPVANLLIQADASLLNAELTQDQVNANILGPGRKGDRIPYVPEVTAGLSAQYTWPVTNAVNGMARVDADYVGSSYSEFNPSNIYRRKLPAYSITNLRIGIEAPDKNYGVYLFVNNIFNRLAITAETASALTAGQTVTTSAPPRTIGLTVRKSF